MTRKNKLNLIVFFLYCAALLLMSGFKSAEMYLHYINGFEKWLGGDKLMHLYLAMVLALLAMPVARAVTYKNKALNVFTLFIILITCLLLDELHQAMVGSRHFDSHDTLYGGLGLIIGLTIRLFFERFFIKNN